MVVSDKGVVQTTVSNQLDQYLGLVLAKPYMKFTPSQCLITVCIERGTGVLRCLACMHNLCEVNCIVTVTCSSVRK